VETDDGRRPNKARANFFFAGVGILLGALARQAARHAFAGIRAPYLIGWFRFRDRFSLQEIER
jgi:hypothetical protein